jgi:hypothetical protein
MNPVEVLFVSLGVVIMLIALARGYRLELGSMVIIMVAIFVLTFFDSEINNLFTPIGNALIGRSSNSEALNLFLMIVFQLVFVIIVFMGYAGRTLAFGGTELPPPQGTLLTLTIGALDGYLIAGTLWYYLDIYGYPVQSIGLICLPLTTIGQQLVTILPQRLFESPTYWMIPVAALLILRVRG